MSTVTNQMSTVTVGLDPSNFVSTNNAQQDNYCAAYNSNVSELYALAVANYNLSMDNGSLYPGPVPAVPNGLILGPANAAGLRFAQPSGQPACAALAIHPLRGSVNDPKAPGIIDVGHKIPDTEAWFSVGDADTFPKGQTTPPVTSEDGVTGAYQKYGAPVGPGWYLKVG